MIKRLFTVCCSMFLFATMLMAQSPPSSQSPFVPVSSLPPVDQVPAAPLIITAYAFVWLAVLFYVWTVWRRLNKVEIEMQALQRRSDAR